MFEPIKIELFFGESKIYAGGFLSKKNWMSPTSNWGMQPKYVVGGFILPSGKLT